MNMMWRWSLPVLLVMLLCACGREPVPPAAPVQTDTFTFGIILPGAADDDGWGAAHCAGGRYVERNRPDMRLLVLDNLNRAARPGMTVAMAADSLAAQGAKLIIAASADFADGVLAAAQARPDLYFVSVGSDEAWADGRNFRAPANVSNVMGRMEYGKNLAGFAAGMATQTGKLGYVGPMDNAEARRLAAATYLGARHAWVYERQRDAADLEFTVAWIGYWFHIPGQTLDPAVLTRDFAADGCDVVISGINTSEVLVEAGKLHAAGNPVLAVPYDYHRADRAAAEVSLGIPYFNWGPAYLELAQMAEGGYWRQQFMLPGAHWPSRNDPSIGFVRGAALTPAMTAALDRYAAELDARRIVPFRGPLNFRDGTPFLADGEEAIEAQVWYLPQLLQGMRVRQ